MASAASAAGALFAEPLRAAAPPPEAVTPALIEAARKEGKVSFYRLARVFEARYPGITVRVERSGAERIFQRIAQEQNSGIRAVDVANSTDPAHYLDWRNFRISRSTMAARTGRCRGRRPLSLPRWLEPHARPVLVSGNRLQLRLQREGRPMSAVWQILLQKSFWGGERKFSEPLMRLARGDERDHIASSKIDHEPP